MLTMSDTALAVVARSHVLHTRVVSILGDTVLADDVPIAAGTLEVDRSLRVPERLTFTVPRADRGVSWVPAPNHPLGWYGQRVRLSLGVEVPGAVEWIDRGEFLIVGADAAGDTVTVEAAGLLALVDEARFTVPFQPGGTFQSTIRALVEPALTVIFSGTPTDRAVPSGLAWDEDRLAALEEMLDAWPAVAAVDSTGVLRVTAAADPTEAVLTLTDGTGGTVLRWSGQGSRDGAANLVVARGQQADGAQVQGVAYDLDPTSPTYFGGDFAALPVPAFFSSPLLTTVAQCQAAASTILARRQRDGARTVAAELVPHPGLETGDLVELGGEQAGTATVEGLRLPITPAGGSMTLALRTVT